MRLRLKDIGRCWRVCEGEMVLKIGHKERFVFIISILLLTNLTILLDTPFIRQVIGFLLLTLLPGLLILQILKLDKIDFLEKVILAWGLSISFLMFFGLLLSNLLFLLGYETPLSITPLLISLNLTFILLIIMGYKTNKEAFSFAILNLNLNTSEKLFLIVPCLFPALSIFGMHIMNTTDSNIILMFLLFLIPIYVAFVCFFNHSFPKRIYPVVIYLISISLLLLLSLRSDHLIGMDVHTEYYYFLATLENSRWSVLGYTTLDACLAISLLPTIYQLLLNMPTEFLYKILPSLIYSASPLVIYVISKKYVGESYAFLASCFYMFQSIFLWTEYNARANIAMLFFAFAMLTLFNDKINPLQKKVLFIIFMASCVVSHYSTTYIFFFVMVGTLIGIEALSKKYTFKKIISSKIVILFFIMIFFWYSQVTEGAFDQGVNFIEKTFKSLHEFFVVETRGSGQALLGKDIEQKGIPHKIEFVLTWLTFAYIGIGVITLIRRYKEASFPELKFEKPHFLKDKFEIVYFVITLMCCGLLVAVITFPHIGKGYGLGRLYPLAITILSVFFVIGGVMITKYLNQIVTVLRGTTSIRRQSSRAKRVLDAEVEEVRSPIMKNVSQVWVYLIILLVLIPYFFCTTGIMYNMFGYPRAITLNSEGEGYDNMYVHDQDSYGAKWVGTHHEKDLEIYGDTQGRIRLKSQTKPSDAVKSRSLISPLIQGWRFKGYLYLWYRNVVHGELIDSKGEIYNMTDYSDTFIEKNRLYDNGGSEVWK